jgi:hypothetical protein
MKKQHATTGGFRGRLATLLACSFLNHAIGQIDIKIQEKKQFR